MSSRRLYEGDWVVGLREDELHHPQQPEAPFTRLVLEDPGAVIILALNEDDEVAVLHQYRHPVNHRLVELPAGKLDVVGESALSAAQRELREEAGLAATHWHHLLTTFVSPGITAETHALYVAWGLREVSRDFELTAEEADMTLAWVPRSDLVDAVLAGQVGDAGTVSAVLAYEVALSRGLLTPAAPAYGK